MKNTFTVSSRPPQALSTTCRRVCIRNYSVRASIEGRKQQALSAVWCSMATCAHVNGCFLRSAGDPCEEIDLILRDCIWADEDEKSNCFDETLSHAASDAYVSLGFSGFGLRFSEFGFRVLHLAEGRWSLWVREEGDAPTAAFVGLGFMV